MLKIAFVFPGQGSQYVGMGKAFYDNFKVAKDLFEEASDILGFDLAKLCFEGPEEELRKTLNTQPAILVHSVVAMKLLKLDDIHPIVVAGHSLGEFSANVAAGSISFADAVSTVRLRGELMYESGVKVPGTMAAIIGLDTDVVRQICDEAAQLGVCQLANFNSPGQIVISGQIAAIKKAIELATDKGAKRALELPVSGAFHSKLMETACPGLTEKLEQIDIQKSEIPIIANATAEPVSEPDEIRKVLIDQLSSPVRWVESMQKIIDMGVDTMIEAGPGKVLKGLMRRIDRSVKVLNVEDSQTLQKTFHQVR